ncbi:prepilin-type N-terminal cleavage/methylation domain-containing protein [Candidatus Daviesbacteria bacterium]|nr:prepilin-type N-terminal cleavage/methylation domain-containing protein [Candidatus Daviesbacteria bacterium]
MNQESGFNKNSSAFTLAEILVVMAITSIVGAILVVIFTNTLRGSNKSQILAVIKQNGQAVLETMDKNVRNSDNVICPTLGNPSNTLVIVKNGCYTRYKFIVPSPTQNGQIQQDNPQPDPSTPCAQNSPTPAPTDIQSFINSVCTDPMVNPTVLTDTNEQSGVSVECPASDCSINPPPVFTRDKPAGAKDQVTIKFNLKPGVSASSAITSQIDPVTFQTTIGLR